MQRAKDLYQQGKLSEAIQYLNDFIKANPPCVDERVFLATLLLFSGELMRIDILLDQAGLISPELTISLSLFRQLVRAEKWRSEVFTQKRSPEFIGTPPLWLKQTLLSLPPNNDDNVITQIPPIIGHHNDQAFSDIRDLDDICAHFLEVLTSTGKYFWIALTQIDEIVFHAPKTARDLYWRQATLSVIDGPEGDVFIPAIYYNSFTASDNNLKLGRASDWQAAGNGNTYGIGQRCLLLSEEVIPILQLSNIVIQRNAINH